MSGTVAPRYSRNVQALSPQECETLQGKRVCVVGCGGLGGYCLEQLARIGVGHLVAIDSDVFEPSNLNRQILASEATLGQPQVAAARERLALVNPEVSVETHQVRLDSGNAGELIAGCDCVIDALDNRPSRIDLAHACQEAGIPLVYGAIGGWFGQVCTVFPGDVSFIDIYGSTEGQGIQKQEGNLPFTAAVTASFQVAECVKVLLDKPDLLRNRLLMIETLYGSCEVMDLA
ncbi:MAG: HesA/MoeB/ThiF family protein [Coriobacteriales bacterium]|nr:HesA/MoeB/ThiF family protein [Coriobacteriales bacterium]